MSEQHEHNVVRIIDELRDRTLSKWNEIDSVIERAQSKVKSLWLETGRLLLQLKQCVDAGEVGELAIWWEWYADNFPKGRSQSDAQRLIAMASAPDPETAEQEARAKNRQHQKTHRELRRRMFATIRSSDAGRAYVSANNEINGLASGKAELSLVEPAKPEEQDTSQDDLIDQIITLFKQLTWANREKATQRLTQVYRDWHKWQE
jgi:hypothetical protein